MKILKASTQLRTFRRHFYGFASVNGQAKDVWVWGSNQNGQLGIGKPDNHPNHQFPQQLDSYQFTNISAGNGASAGIKDGQIYAWGNNINGKLGLSIPGITYQPTLVQLTGNHIQILQAVKQVTLKYSYLSALTESGQAYVWGNTSRRRPHVQVATINAVKFIQIASGGDGKIALIKDDGTLFIYQIKSKKISQLPIPGSKKIKQVQAGLDHFLALSVDGKVYVWGKNDSYQLGTGNTLDLTNPTQLNMSEKIVEISCGDKFSAVVTENGDGYTWGLGNSGQLGHEDTNNKQVPTKIDKFQTGPKKIKKIACGGSHTAILTKQGQLWMAGRGNQGQLGRDPTSATANTRANFQKKPVIKLPPNKKISQIVCGAKHTMALFE